MDPGVLGTQPVKSGSQTGAPTSSSGHSRDDALPGSGPSAAAVSFSPNDSAETVSAAPDRDGGGDQRDASANVSGGKARKRLASDYDGLQPAESEGSPGVLAEGVPNFSPASRSGGALSLPQQHREEECEEAPGIRSFQDGHHFPPGPHLGESSHPSRDASASHTPTLQPSQPSANVPSRSADAAGDFYSLPAQAFASSAGGGSFLSSNVSPSASAKPALPHVTPLFSPDAAHSTLSSSAYTSAVDPQGCSEIDGETPPEGTRGGQFPAAGESDPPGAISGGQAEDSASFLSSNHPPPAGPRSTPSAMSMSMHPPVRTPLFSAVSPASNLSFPNHPKDKDGLPTSPSFSNWGGINNTQQQQQPPPPVPPGIGEREGSVQGYSSQQQGSSSSQQRRGQTSRGSRGSRHAPPHPSQRSPAGAHMARLHGGDRSGDGSAPPVQTERERERDGSRFHGEREREGDRVIRSRRAPSDVSSHHTAGGGRELGDSFLGVSGSSYSAVSSNRQPKPHAHPQHQHQQPERERETMAAERPSPSPPSPIAPGFGDGPPSSHYASSSQGNPLATGQRYADEERFGRQGRPGSSAGRSLRSGFNSTTPQGPFPPDGQAR
eukprot:Cvel_30985.t1-p1 / transcript=Cvel_30985.t1 / gene=Cvel_30985 / organism=Chromera_velia_CCMP2878 / gene_product=DNA-directed RNA polymerase II subunit RPB1, putative / transcript_product=DNA-directed RNA polymerase II subunit RPB1, putative / location=Cvel_scaffold4525:1-1820(-) / protein_length=606 / sequence_SO=supercontig / SO=protein_coding / is_pseudo=false